LGVNCCFTVCLREGAKLPQCARVAKKTKYFFNPKSLSFEKVSSNYPYLIGRALGFLSLAAILGVGMAFLFTRFFATTLERGLLDDNRKLRNQIKAINQHVGELDRKMNELAERDNQIYRMIYETDPLKPEEEKIQNYSELLQLSEGELLVSLRKKIDKLQFMAVHQNKSYQQLEKLVKAKTAMLNSIPAIQPVANKDLDRMASGYGYRIDPFYHSAKFHAGMDFTAPPGTHVFATGDGVVSDLKRDEWGYGNHIIISHGYGYTTVYAHLSGFKVKKGQKVVRGELIGYVGNTGKSTGPHLHYEVRKNNHPLNPAFFYFNDLSDADYARMLQKASETTKSFD
jgi:murein DD-endopeptidase MepM/ murein hydrolase activator NlpD